jgi:hypothetical protein
VIKRTSLTIHEDGEGAEMQTKSIEKPIQWRYRRKISQSWERYEYPSTGDI